MIREMLFAAMFSGAAFAAQAQSASFSMAATIAPSPCTISFGGGGVIDFGSLSRESLTIFTTDFYSVARQQMSMAVTCPAPTKFALAFTDNRDGTATGTPGTILDAAFGLGTYHGQNIGSVSFHTGRLQIRTTAGGVLQAPATSLLGVGARSTSTWLERVTTSRNYFRQTMFRKGASLAYAASANARAPDALTEVSGDVIVDVYLSRPVVDTATSSIPLDGSGTMTLILL